VANLEAEIVALRESVAAWIESATAVGVGKAAQAAEKEGLERMVEKLRMIAEAAAIGNPELQKLLPVAGDNSSLRKDPRALGGGTGAGKKRPRSQRTASDGAPAQLLKNTSTGKRKQPKQLRQQLEATPKPADAE
jgi:hypothetical protein